MDFVFYSIEKGEKWLTPFEKRQWGDKWKALRTWLQSKGVEISPWVQVRLREFLILTFFIQRLEQELLFVPMKNKQEKEEDIELQKKMDKSNAPIQCYEILCKYMERQRKLVQEFEEIKPVEVKMGTVSIAELVEDLMNCARELDKGNGKIEEDFISPREHQEISVKVDD